jgi:hypothetical protein
MILASVVGVAGLLATATVAATNSSILIAVTGFALTLTVCAGCFIAPALTVLVLAAAFASINGVLGSNVLAMAALVYSAAFAVYFGPRLRPLRLRQLADY